MSLTAGQTVGIGMLQGASNMFGAGKQHKRNKEMMGISHQNQQQLNRQGHQLQMDMWNKTNYGAQVAQMEKAGLNPALMYGMGGGGGTTAGSQGGGNASSGGNAVQMHPMDMANLALLKAQTDNINTDTELKEANTEKIGGVDTKEAEQRIANMKESKDYIKMQKEYQEIVNANKQDEIDAFLKNIGQKTENLKQQFDLTDEQWGDLLKMQMGKALTAVENSNLLKSKVKLTDAQEQEVWEKLDIAYNRLELEGLSIDAVLKKADADMIRAKVIEAMEPMKLEVEKKRIMIDSMTRIVTTIIGGVSSAASSYIGASTERTTHSYQYR